MPHLAARGRRPAWCVVGVLVLVAKPPVGLTQAPEPGTRRTVAYAEFPPNDRWSHTLLNAAKIADDLDRKLASGLADADLPGLLADRDRHAEALDAFERIVDTRPDLLAEALSNDFASTVSRAAAVNYRPRLAALLERATATLASLPREQAAATARRLISAGWEAHRPVERGEVEGQLRAFVNAFQGTETALLTEVDVLEQSRPSLGLLEALEAFADLHPGTTAAAKALYQVGFHLAHNNSIVGATPRGADPTPRFLRVAAIVDELRTGRHPDSQWVDDADELLVGFSFYGATFSDWPTWR